MTRLYCRLAESQREIADAQRVRWIVYGEEERLLAPGAAHQDREVDARDLDVDTAHVIVYADDEPVGTVRLLPPRAGRGFELESNFRLGVPPSQAFVGGEVTRYCVVRGHRCTAAARMLHDALTAESLRRGITHWFAAANLETDSAEDAALVYEIMRARNLVDARFHAEPRRTSPAAGRRRCYTDEALRQAGDARLGLELPRVIALFTGRMGARCMGLPAYDPYFNVFALPIVADVAPVRGGFAISKAPSVRPAPAAPGLRARP